MIKLFKHFIKKNHLSLFDKPSLFSYNNNNLYKFNLFNFNKKSNKNEEENKQNLNQKEKPNKQNDKINKEPENNKPNKKEEVNKLNNNENDKQGNKQNQKKKSKQEEDELIKESISKVKEEMNKRLQEAPPTSKIKVHPNEKYNIIHHYEKSSENRATKKDKELLESLAKQMLINENLSSSEAEKLKDDVRNILKYTKAPNLLEIDTFDDVLANVDTFAKTEFYRMTHAIFERLYQLQRELREQTDPLYIKIRSQDRLLKNQEMVFPTPKATDMRQNANSPDYLKIQPRLNLNYNYNFEQNKEFKIRFDQYMKEDEEKLLEKHRILKYIKLHPDNQQVKDRLIPKYLTKGVTLDQIPDYDVDITGWKPAVTRKSRRKYLNKKIDTNISNYEAWRCFDREFPVWSEEHCNLKVFLRPKYLQYVILF
jgi:hypothetical protein